MPGAWEEAVKLDEGPERNALCLLRYPRLLQIVDEEFLKICGRARDVRC